MFFFIYIRFLRFTHVLLNSIFTRLVFNHCQSNLKNENTHKKRQNRHTPTILIFFIMITDLSILLQIPFCVAWANFLALNIIYFSDFYVPYVIKGLLVDDRIKQRVKMYQKYMTLKSDNNGFWRFLGTQLFVRNLFVTYKSPLKIY